ncbi:hypothetical protein ACLGI4_02995 [Streptomyces sp. HMX112]
MTKKTACALAALAALGPAVALAPSAIADDTSGHDKQTRPYRCTRR